MAGSKCTQTLRTNSPYGGWEVKRHSKLRRQIKCEGLNGVARSRVVLRLASLATRTGEELARGLVHITGHGCASIKKIGYFYTLLSSQNLGSISATVVGPVSGSAGSFAEQWLVIEPTYIMSSPLQGASLPVSYVNSPGEKLSVIDYVFCQSYHVFIIFHYIHSTSIFNSISNFCLHLHSLTKSNKI